MLSLGDAEDGSWRGGVGDVTGVDGTESEGVVPGVARAESELNVSKL